MFSKQSSAHYHFDKRCLDRGFGGSAGGQLDIIILQEGEHLVSDEHNSSA